MAAFARTLTNAVREPDRPGLCAQGV